MWETALIILFLLVVIGILITNVIYKNHCIEDLEIRIKNMNKSRNNEILKILKQLETYQKFESAGREICTRNYIEDCIEKYSKNELNTDFDRYNV